MHSLSELDTTSKRASRAAGYSWGISEEIGLEWQKQINESEKEGKFGFTSFPVLTYAYLI